MNTCSFKETKLIIHAIASWMSIGNNVYKIENMPRTLLGNSLLAAWNLGGWELA